MSSYYLTLVLKPDQDEGKRKSLLEGLVQKATGDSGKVSKEDLWGIRDLSYPIKKQNKGFFAHFELETEPEMANTIDKMLRVEEDVLRYLLIRR